MARLARLVLPGLLHHVTQRGNNRAAIFFSPPDRAKYLDLLKQQSAKFRLRVLGYCLMPNHVHLIVVPETKASLARALGRTHWRYAQYVNRARGRSGHVWQNRFYSCPLDEKHGWFALRYVECNPVRAKLVRQAWEYEWSSAAAHVGEPDRAGVLDLETWRRDWDTAEWRRELRRAADSEVMELLRARCRSGRVLAAERVLDRLEKRLGRRLRPLPVGRPAKRGGK